MCSNLPPDTNKTCPSGTAIRRILSNGTVTCITVPTNTNVFGKSCSSGQTLRGFTSSGNPICDTPKLDVKLASKAYSPKGSGSTTSSCPTGYKIVGCVMKSSSYYGNWPQDGDLNSGMHDETGSNNERIHVSNYGIYAPTSGNEYCRGWSTQSGGQRSRTMVQAVCAKIEF